MKKLLAVFVGIFLSTAAITPVLATGITCGQLCTAQIIIGSATFNVPVTVGPNGLGTVSEFSVTGLGGSTASINSLTLNPDPFIIFAVAGTNNTDNPLAFSFIFNEPINLTDPTIHAASSIGYTLTDGFLASQGTSGAAGVTIAPFNGPNILVANDFTPTLSQVNKGVDIGPAASGGIAPCGAFVGATSNCGPFAATHDFGGGPFTLMAAQVSFVLTPHDSAGLSGSVSQVPAPEPTTLLLMASGLLGIAGWRRYSRR